MVQKSHSQPPFGCMKPVVKNGDTHKQFSFCNEISFCIENIFTQRVLGLQLVHFFNPFKKTAVSSWLWLCFSDTNPEVSWINLGQIVRQNSLTFSKLMIPFGYLHMYIYIYIVYIIHTTFYIHTTNKKKDEQFHHPKPNKTS